MNNCALEHINLGTLPDGTFPLDNCKTYIYKRTNGHIYVYSNNSEKHVCCDDGLINSIPIFTSSPSIDNKPIHIPDSKHLFLFIYNGILKGYDKDLNIINVCGDIDLEWNINEWD